MNSPNPETNEPGEPRPAHTPEPWNVAFVGRFEDVVIRDANGNQVARPIGSPIWEATAVAERIVACVNACAGMADPAAEIAALREKAWKYDQLCE